LRSGQLLREADVFFAEHLDVLGRLSQRVAIDQIVEAAGALGGALPRRMKPRRAVGSGTTPTQIAEEDTYPVRGFASMSTSGTIENLVPSELIYMDDSRDVDLFDVRYVEGELLYYVRDESALRRKAYAVSFVFEPSLERARFKDEGVPWQRLVLT